MRGSTPCACTLYSCLDASLGLEKASRIGDVWEGLPKVGQVQQGPPRLGLGEAYLCLMGI